MKMGRKAWSLYVSDLLLKFRPNADSTRAAEKKINTLADLVSFTSLCTF